MSHLPLCNAKGDSLGEYEIADDLLIYDKGEQAMHDAVVFYLANQRAGTASTLGKGEVNGSNRKLWKQKGTGRARTGLRQSPIWRGGGVVFGPKPRDFRKHLPKKVAKLAFRRALSEKVAAGDITVLDALSISEPKTKIITDLMKNLEIPRKVLFVVDDLNEALALSVRNLANAEVELAKDVNTYQLLRYPRIVVTKDGMEKIVERLGATTAEKGEVA